MKSWAEPIIAAAGLAGTMALLNTAGGLVIMLLTVFILALRARKEYRHRNDPPRKDDL